MSEDFFPQILEVTLACSLTVLKGRAAESVLCLPLMSGTDPVEEMEPKISSERPGLQSPEPEARKQDFCRGDELSRSNMTPECEDKLRASLQPAKISWKYTDTLKLKCTTFIHMEPASAWKWFYLITDWIIKKKQLTMLVNILTPKTKWTNNCSCDISVVEQKVQCGPSEYKVALNGKRISWLPVVTTYSDHWLK